MSSVHFQSSDQGVKRQERRKTRKTDLLISNETFSSDIQTLWLTFKCFVPRILLADFQTTFFCKAKKTIIQMEFLKWNQSVIVFMTLEDLSQLRKCSSFSLLSRIELQILVESGMVQVKKVVAKWSSEDKATRGGDMHKFSLVNKLISMLFAHFNAFLLTLFQN